MRQPQLHKSIARKLAALPNRERIVFKLKIFERAVKLAVQVTKWLKDNEN
jgi:hypothetical protein